MLHPTILCSAPGFDFKPFFRADNMAACRMEQDSAIVIVRPPQTDKRPRPSASLAMLT
jgi:hypothetical protein